MLNKVPDSVKDKVAGALGLGKLKSRSIEILNPAARRAEILDKLEKNVYTIQNASTNKNGSGGAASGDKKINIGGELESDVAPVIEESKTLITELKELNPKTGILPKIVDKIIGGGSPASTNTVDLNQLTPEQKSQVCK